ncbi:AAA family ATPase [Corynebacterium epidermidicanis]|uniref:Putative ATPase n=1 Tax=Corynebacterium epidermidicanis TaxID=1050174 RepID=A0A0G3GSL1_9CORY|nr:AAA family ATPase [Corynebacterium epidermidicanis]AKK03570.1 putative ATPase [Corynebacterium epidermidicanis]
MTFISGFELSELEPGEDNAYLRQLPIVKSLLGAGRIDFTSSVTFLVGENGAGKSTLVEALAVGMRFNPAGGTRNSLFSSADTVSELHYWLRIFRSRNPRDGYFLRAEAMNKVFSYYDAPGFYDPRFGPRMHTMSHGESSLHLLKNRFHANGLYLLDEPESGLSPDSQIVAAARIADLARRGAQFIIATHSPIILAVPGAEILEIRDGALTRVSYEETSLVEATREFIDDPLGTAAYLCEADPIPED